MSSRLLHALAVLAVLAVGVVLLGRVLPSALPLLGPDCTASTSGGDVDLSREQARSVTQLAAAAVRDGVDEGQVAAAVRQVRDQDGPVLDAAAAAGQVLAAAAPEPPAEPADPADLALARTLLGFEQGALSCGTGRPDRVDEPAGPDGLTPRAQRLRAELETSFGPQSLGGFAPGGVSEGHIEGSAHYEGRAVDVFFRPISEPGTRQGWAVSHWLVAHAEELDVATVIFDRQIWSAGRSAQGWRPYTHPSGDVENPVLAHEDHVHVDVGR